MLRSSQLLTCMCRQFFAAKLEQLQSSVLPKLDQSTVNACTIDRFALAAAAVRARLFPPFSNQEPCLAIGTELVRLCHVNRQRIVFQKAADLPPNIACCLVLDFLLTKVIKLLRPALHLQCNPARVGLGLIVHTPLQIRHARAPNVQLQMSGGSVFQRSKALQVLAVTPIVEGKDLCIDYAPGKLESQVWRTCTSVCRKQSESCGLHCAVQLVLLQLVSAAPASESGRCHAARHCAITPARTPRLLRVQVALDFGVYADDTSQPGYLLTLSLPGEDDDKCFFDKQDIVEQQGLGESESFVLRAREAPPDDMLAYLRLMNIGGAQVAHIIGIALLALACAHYATATRACAF
jgi:Rubisco LSMT substrate-binding